MEEHERIARAAQEVDKRIVFYVHLAVFLLVCGGFAAVNFFATPEVWWAQWPFLGWGCAVIFHALCAFRSGPGIVAGWRLRKIRQLSGSQEPDGGGRAATSRTRILSFLLLGLLVASFVGVGYMYVLLQDAYQNARKTEASRDALEKAANQQDAQLKQMSAEKSALEAAVKDTKDQLTQAQAAKDAAERALADAKKGPAQ